MGTTTEKLAYRIPEAAAALGIGRTKLYDLIAEGKVRRVKIGGIAVIPAEDLQALLAQPAAA